MTEQPVETEQQFLGNEAPAVVINLGTAPVPPEVPASVRQLQHYSPNAHLRRPSWAPVDDVELGSLARKLSHKNKLLAIARKESVRAEEALKVALGVEHQAEEAVREAEEALIHLMRKDTGL